MRGIFSDFVKSVNTKIGYGFFEGLGKDKSGKDFVDNAMRLSKSKIRKLYRHGIVPLEFIDYLKSINVLPEKLNIPTKKRTVGTLADILLQVQYKNECVRGLADHIREQILISFHPEMKVMFGSSNKIWKIGEIKSNFLVKQQKNKKREMHMSV